MFQRFQDIAKMYSKHVIIYLLIAQFSTSQIVVKTAQDIKNLKHVFELTAQKTKYRSISQTHRSSHKVHAEN